MLEHFLTLSTFHIALVFVRMGATFMLMPGLSAAYVPTRVRLLVALAVTLVVVPLVRPVLPDIPDTVAAIVALVVLEALYGVFLGLLGQFCMAALHLAGTSISRDISLMNAMVQDPVTAQQGAVVIGLLMNTAIVLMLVMDLHHLVIQAVVASYGVFLPGSNPLPIDHLTMLVETLSQAFLVGMQLASPFLVYAIVVQVVLGVVSRLSPQMNVFFVAMPVMIAMGLVILMIVLPSIMLWYLNFFEETYVRFLP